MIIPQDTKVPEPHRAQPPPDDQERLLERLHRLPPEQSRPNTSQSSLPSAPGSVASASAPYSRTHTPVPILPTIHKPSPLAGFQAPEPELPSSTELTIRRILFVSLGVTVVSFALSMVYLGFMSFWIASAGAGCSAIFDISLLLIHGEQLRQLSRTGLRRQKLPTVVRLPGLCAAFCLVFVWTGAVAMLMYTIAYYQAWNFHDQRGKILAPAWELVCAVIQLQLLGAYIVLALKERRRLKRKASRGDFMES